MKVGFSQINTSFSGQVYLPYSVGLLQAYAQKYVPRAHQFEFMLPVFTREPIEASARKMEGANIVFFSTYVWNVRQSLELAKLLKRKDPEVVTVFGGPQVPNRADEFLRQNPFVDLAVHGEGEQVIAAILDSDFVERAQAKDWSGFHSVSYVDSNGLVVKTKSYERIKDINLVPSPFLTGTFDALMAAYPKEKWILTWETNRGCPFSCAYCDWGSATQSKVYKFDLDRLYREIDWMAEHKIEFVFCADANFGMLERDIELAQYVAESKRRTGYPHAISVQNAKNSTERAYKIQKILSDAGLNKGVSLSLQSTDSQTLKNIKRANISSESFQELQRRFTRDNIETYTDIILGLPGETYDSFRAGVEKVVENGQHNRILFNNLSILPNAAMGEPAYQEEHGLVLVENPVVNHHGSITATDDEIRESQVLVVGTKTCPKEDWVKVRSFAWMSQILYFNKVFQIPILLLCRNFDLSFSDLISVFTDGPLDGFPTLKQIRTFFIEKARDIQSGGCEFCPSEKYLNIWWPADELVLIELCAEDKFDKFYAEASLAVQRHLKEKGVEIPIAVLDEAVRLNKLLMKMPYQTKDLDFQLNYNVWEAYLAARAGENVTIRFKPGSFKIDRTTKTWDKVEDWCREVVWWGNKKGAYMYSASKVEPQLDGHY